LNVLDALDKSKYQPVMIGIDKAGQWHLNDQSDFLLNETNPKLISLNGSQQKVALRSENGMNQLVRVDSHEPVGVVDVIFPVLHGTNGEDGTIQGLLKIAGVPFVGAGVLGSAVGMDKDVTKRLLRDAGILVADFLAFNSAANAMAAFSEVTSKLGLPVFVKPANLGSSVGISKANNAEEFRQAIHDAFQYDRKVLVEQSVVGQEIECSVLGNAEPIASLPGEILPQHEFYSYEAKYIDENGAVLKIPANLSDEATERVRHLAIRAYQVLCCEGMARVDMFVRENGEIIINEINTIPGFTRISMYPKLWEASGISYPELLDRLINLAIERHIQESALKTSIDL